MNKKPVSRIGRLLAAAAFALLVAAMALIYARFGAKPVSGSKSITISVVSSAAQTTSYALHTDAEYLIEAMEEAEGLTFQGSEGPYGMMLSEINGEKAIFEENGAYWSITVNGEYGNYGVSEQPVHDGDAFVIAYTK